MTVKRIPLYAAVATSLALGGALLLGTCAVAKDEAASTQTSRPQASSTKSPALTTIAPTAKTPVQGGLVVRPQTGWTPGLKPQAPQPSKHGTGLGYGLHAGSTQPVGRASIREASAGLAASAAVNSATPSTPLSVGSVTAFRPPLDTGPVRAGSLRADIARYSAERSGRGPAESSSAELTRMPQTYSPNLYRN